MTNSLMTNSEDVQSEIFKQLEEILTPYYKELINESNWRVLSYSIINKFDFWQWENSILNYKIICNNNCSDLILEYDIPFSEGWFLYCHLRKGHLMLKFVPKEF